MQAYGSLYNKLAREVNAFVPRNRAISKYVHAQDFIAPLFIGSALLLVVLLYWLKR